MTIVKHELRLGKLQFFIWTFSVGFLLAICIFMFPEIKQQMDSVGDIFSSMGSFTEAFGMDRLNFGTLIGFYAVECGNILGIGGAFYASLCAAVILSKEEKDRTAEFLLTHPVKRIRIVTEKLISIIVRITAMNAAVYALTLISILFIGENIPWKELNLLHAAYYLLQIELAGICFGISAFMRKGSIGAGLGLAATMYFLNIIANISDSAEFLKYLTLFGFCEGADIVSNGKINGAMLAVGAVLCALGVSAAYIKYMKKDIH